MTRRKQTLREDVHPQTLVELLNRIVHALHNMKKPTIMHASDIQVGTRRHLVARAGSVRWRRTTSAGAA
jgi:hypothetical protein